MNREEKNALIESLADIINGSKHFYLTDTGNLNAEQTSNLRRKCFEKEIKLIVAKNTLLKLALEKAVGEYSELYPALKGQTSVMLTESGSLPAKLIKEFRKNSDKPVLKAAYVEECFYLGDNQLDVLANLKTKEELIGDIIMLLQSPMKNVLSSLQSGPHILAGVIKTLSERKE